MKTIGVSSFLPDNLQNLLADCRVKNRLLLHITSTDLPLPDFCRSHRILVGTYSPLPTAKPSRTPPFRKWRKNTAPPAQLCIRCALKLGAVALPKTANPAHMADNAKVDFSISSEGTEALKAMKHIETYGDFDVFPVFSGNPLSRLFSLDISLPCDTMVGRFLFKET